MDIERVREFLDQVSADQYLVSDFSSESGSEFLHASFQSRHRQNSEYTVALLLTENFAGEPEELIDETVRANGRLLVGRHKWKQDAIGSYLSMCETHGLSESTAKEAISDAGLLDEFEATLENWSMRDRRHHLLDLLESSSDPRNEYTLENGSFRTVTSLRNPQLRLVSKLISNSSKDPGACYESAITATDEFRDSDRIKYAEGAVLPVHGGDIHAHAWVELDGCVVEPTFPWHRPVPPSNAVYFGTTFPPEDAFEIMMDHGQRFQTILMNPDGSCRVEDVN